MNGGHREIDHTADLGFEVWAPTLPGMYAEAAAALAELCYDLDAVAPTDQRRLVVRGVSAEERVVRWLQDIYLLLESDRWLMAHASDVQCVEDRIEGTLHGEVYDPTRHTLHTEIKAVTYHGMQVEKIDGLWRTTVIVDV